MLLLSKQTWYFSWESYGWDSCGISKQACLGRNCKSFVLFNSMCGKTCSLSRSVLMNRSIKQTGISSDSWVGWYCTSIGPAAFSQRACREWLPPGTRGLKCCREDLHGSAGLRCGSCIVYGVWSVTVPQKLTAVLVGWPTGKRPLAFKQLLQA